MDAIAKLIKLREKSYVRKDIVFVFSLLTRASLKGTRGNRTFRSAELLKYCGIVSWIADLDETNLCSLASHMGYVRHAHREFYHFHDSNIEIKKVAQLFWAIGEGNASSFSGKNAVKILQTVILAMRIICIYVSLILYLIF